MKILYDHQAFVLQKQGGVSRYFAVLIKRIREVTGADAELSLLFSDNQYLKENRIEVGAGPNKKSSNNNVMDFLRSGLRRYRIAVRVYDSLKKRLNERHSITRLERQDFDIFHPTYYDPYFLKPLGEKPFVLTVHDMIHELYREYFSSKDMTPSRKKLLANNAAMIIAVSQNTKNDIIRLLGIPSDNITVVHHANFLDPSHQESISLPNRYILHVGGRARYKNFPFFIESISPLLKKEKDLFVVCFGAGEFDSQEKNLLSSLAIDHKVMHVSGNDAQLIYAYKKAECLSFPSLYEGFGIPILEAFACGCPVALSEASCFPEIAGNAGIYFNPQDRKSILETMQKIIGNKELQDDLRNKGFERLKNFSPEKMIQETHDVYKNALR